MVLICSKMGSGFIARLLDDGFDDPVDASEPFEIAIQTADGQPPDCVRAEERVRPQCRSSHCTSGRPRQPRRADALRKRIAPKTDSADETVSSESIAMEMYPGLSGWAP